MAAMNEHPLARIEARIAGLVEGAFAQVFGGSNGLQTVIASLTTALEDAVRESKTADGQRVKPQRLRVRMRHDQIEALTHAWPGIEDSLARLVAEHSAAGGPRPLRVPEIVFVADDTLAPGLVVITADEPDRRDPTGILPRVAMPSSRYPREALLITEAGSTIDLTEPITTIGRAVECSISLDDPYASRLHAQIRLRNSRFVVLDAGSQSGTFVNSVRVFEHLLHNGDVLQVGRTRLIYQDQDEPEQDETEAMPPLPPHMD
ncbi:MAG TPA: FhaA domain-containing protein [Candidatus Limnocylindrales bacterium]|nr:FhaA domain-containing protein [Candidatus Limnocylindrales bacterium]